MRRTAATTQAPRTRADHHGRRARSSLHSRLLTRMLLISMVPLLVIGSLTLGSLWALSQWSTTADAGASEEEAAQAAGRAVQADASGAARQVQQLLAERVTDVGDWAAAPAIRGAARTAAVATGDALADTPPDEVEARYSGQRRLRPGSSVERYLRSATERVPTFTQLVLTERNGLAVAAANRPGAIVLRDRRAWTRGWQDGLFIGDATRLGGRNASGLVIAARVENPRSGERFGVLLATLDLAALQDEVTRIAGDDGAAVTVLSGDGALLAETSSGHRGSRLLDPDVELTGDRAEVVDAARAADAPGSTQAGQTLAGFAPLAAADGELTEVLGRSGSGTVAPPDWTVLVERPVEAGAAAAATASPDLDRALRRFAIIVAVTLMLALAAAAIVSTRLAQGTVAPLRRLSTAARDVADTELPALVARAQERGADVEPPRLPAVELQSDDDVAEVAEVAEAFNSVGLTAADLATEQARSRRNVARMFVSLGRRNQSLLSRQLEYIDRLEREESDADVLEHLFQLDHLATRMRRNAESLLVLAGEEPSRRWAEPVPLTDVVRGAVGEIEDYQRVRIEGLDAVRLVGRAVSDVSHLLAELIENATNFSPPDSTVTVTGQRVDEGYSLAVTDHGVGMTSEQFEDANRRIDTSPRVDRVPSSYLGLFVVGRLAARHAIRVRLLESETEGITARVLLPAPIVDLDAAQDSAATGAGVAARAGAAPEADEADEADAVEARVGDHADRDERRAGEEPDDVRVEPDDVRVETDDGSRVPEHAGVGAGVVARSDRHAEDHPPADPAWPRVPRARGRPVDPASAEAGAADPAPPPEIDNRDEVVDRLETTDQLTPVGRDHEAGDASRGRVTDAPDDVPATEARGRETGAPDDEPEPEARDRITDVPGVPPADEPEGAGDRTEVAGEEPEGPEPRPGPPSRPPTDDAPPPLTVRRRVSKRDPGRNGFEQRAGRVGDDDAPIFLHTEPAEQERPGPRRVPAASTDRPASTDDRPAGPSAPAASEGDGVVLTDAERRARLARQRLATFQRAVQHGRAQTARQHDTGARDG